jgi:hypothetical protein
MILAALGAVAALTAGQPPPAPVEPTAKQPIVVGDKTISRGWLRHWTDIAARSAGDREHRRVYRLQAADALIGFRWIRSEAIERGIVVTREETDRSLRRQRRQSFPRRRDFRKFLRSSGQTIEDIRIRVRIDILSNRLRRQVTRGAATPQEQQARLDEFVAAFRSKWRRLTVCRPPWVVDDCGSRVSRSPGSRSPDAHAPDS